jgi:hypothetical protein
MTADIIDFSTRHRTRGADHAPPKPGGALTIIAKNERLRAARREAWRKADAATDFWRAYLDFTDQISRARNADVKEAYERWRRSRCNAR